MLCIKFSLFLDFKNLLIFYFLKLRKKTRKNKFFRVMLIKILNIQTSINSQFLKYLKKNFFCASLF